MGWAKIGERFDFIEILFYFTCCFYLFIFIFHAFLLVLSVLADFFVHDVSHQRQDNQEMKIREEGRGDCMGNT